MPVTSFTTYYTSVGAVRETVSGLASASNVTSATIARQIVYWEGTIHAKLAQRYTVPISLGPLADAILEDIATTGAAYYTLMRMPAAADTERGEWMDRFKERAELLDALAAGSAHLPTSGTQIDDQRIWSNTQHYVPTFGDLPMEEQIPDASELANERSRRNILE